MAEIQIVRDLDPYKSEEDRRFLDEVDFKWRELKRIVVRQGWYAVGLTLLPDGNILVFVKDVYASFSHRISIVKSDELRRALEVIHNVVTKLIEITPEVREYCRRAHDNDPDC